MRKAKPATAKSYLSALRSTHIQLGYDTSAFDDLRIDLVLRGGKRLYGEGTKRLRLPLTAPILCQIINQIGDDHDGVNLKAALCVAFTGFLRSGEFTWDKPDDLSCLARRHVSMERNSVTITLPSSKTDISILLAASPSSPLCPVRALRNLLTRFPRDPSQPLFSRSFGPFSRRYLVDKIKEMLLRAGIPTAGFSGHSLRKGATVSAAANGISRDDIKLLGRWKSDAVDTYINEINLSDHAHKMLQLNSRLHYFPLPTLSSLASAVQRVPPTFLATLPTGT
jgi:integrase